MPAIHARCASPPIPTQPPLRTHTHCSVRAEPEWGVLGKRLGKQMAAVAKAVKTLGMDVSAAPRCCDCATPCRVPAPDTKPALHRPCRPWPPPACPSLHTSMCAAALAARMRRAAADATSPRALLWAQGCRMCHRRAILQDILRYEGGATLQVEGCELGPGDLKILRDFRPPEGSKPGGSRAI